MVKLLVFSSLIIFCSCSTSGLKANAFRGKYPIWVSSPQEPCQADLEICASGSGSRQGSSDLSAKNEIASFFEVKLTSALDSSLSSAKSDDGEWVREQVEEELSAQVDEILQGVQIVERSEIDGRFYSYAKVSKEHLSKVFQDNFEQKSSELKLLMQEGAPSSFYKAKKIESILDGIAQRYHLVTSSKLVIPFSPKQIQSLKYSTPQTFLVRSNKNNPTDIYNRLIGLLNGVGAKTSDENGDAGEIRIEVTKKKEFLNVAGFEKYSYFLSISSFKNNQRWGLVENSWTSTGRSESDAFLKTKKEILDFVEDNFDRLNLKKGD